MSRRTLLKLTALALMAAAVLSPAQAAVTALKYPESLILRNLVDKHFVSGVGLTVEDWIRQDGYWTHWCVVMDAEMEETTYLNGVLVPKSEFLATVSKPFTHLFSRGYKFEDGIFFMKGN